MSFILMLEAVNLSAGFDHPLFENVSLRLQSGEFVGVYGPSGAGKTTFGRTLAGLHKPATGVVNVDGRTVPSKGFHPVQYLHQNPQLAMNPRWRVEQIVSEAMVPSRELADCIGVASDWLKRYPHELSGGQLQRVSVLRALSGKPRFLIADEISASLDPISQAQLWQTLKRIAEQESIGVLVISHDKALLTRVCSSIIQIG
ncbi:ABC transporter ATP-binding protein [Rhodanobacter aciditrophus]|uniref:ABC transporter ATP-binding protein n=1 Tax=Rhodanobacter aciditrophus TaxID=1623218 RepID=A0ABW4B3U4_9GAMM